MFKKALLLSIAIISFLGYSETAKAENDIINTDLYNRLKGKIVLRVEANGEAYYVSPVKKKIYFLSDPKTAFQVMREQGIGVVNSDLDKITIAMSEYFGTDKKFANMQKGKIFLQVEKNGEAWYVNPSDSMRYFLGRPSDAFSMMKKLGLGISESDYEKISTLSVLQEITSKNKTYTAYKDRITETVGGAENVIYKLAKQNDYFVAESPKLKLSPSGYILFFDYFKGESTCRMNGIQLDSKSLLWDDIVGCGAETYWSPDNKQVALAWNHFDGLNLYISSYGDIKKLNKKFEVLAPSNDKSIKFYWKSNSIFVFESSKSDYDSVKESFESGNLKLGINEFVAR